MSTIPQWVTPPGTLGTIPEGVFYSVPLVATADSSVFYRVIAGSLPPGIQINETGVLTGNPTAVSTVQGVPSDITVDTTSQFAVRAYTQLGKLADRTFSLTVAGLSTVTWTTPAGNIGTYFDGVQITDLTVTYNDPDLNAENVVTLVGGELPPGLTVSATGVISGYITPDLTTHITKRTYSFTLRVSNGQTSDVRAFNILVYARVTMTADNTQVTADDTFVTADVIPTAPPVILTPVGSIGSTRSDNFYAFQFVGYSAEGAQIEFVATTSLPPGLTLDPNSGWLYGYIPAVGVTSVEYDFTLEVREVSNPINVSVLYDYSLILTGPVNSDIVWLTPSSAVERDKTPSSLGSIDNGSISTFYVRAVNVAGVPLAYRLASGSTSRLPQGLELLPNGDIAGSVSFNTFALDSGITIFDHGTTTFDMVCTFTVNVYSDNGVINTNKVFSITVIREYNTPYDNLYIKAMPPLNDRAIITGLLQNSDIFENSLIYRSTDPNFGIAKNVTYYHAYGLTPATLDDYVRSLDINHYWKNLVLGQIEVAQARDSSGTVIYEVVYSRIVDNLVNANGDSVSKEVIVPYPITLDDSSQVRIVYPNSLINMRDQVIDTVGQISNVLPAWMTSKQEDGSVLGFIPAWVIAYAKPGKGKQIAYYIGEDFAEQLNVIDYEVDRYELSNLLTKNWDRENQHWIPQPASYTTFDNGIVGIYNTWLNDNDDVVNWVNNNSEFVNWTGDYNGQPTVFDGNSLQFIAPVDMYADTDEYDKYLVFPRRNILE